MVALGAMCCLHSSPDATCPDQDVCMRKIPRQLLLFGKAFKLQQGLGLPGVTHGRDKAGRWLFRRN